jgi:hypothetical protein
LLAAGSQLLERVCRTSAKRRLRRASETTFAFLSAQLCAVRQTSKIGLGEPPGHLRCRLDLPVRVEASRRPFENATDPRTGLMSIAYVSDQLMTTSSRDPQPQTVVAFQKKPTLG